jgi:hypothetical protein
MFSPLAVMLIACEKIDPFSTSHFRPSNLRLTAGDFDLVSYFAIQLRLLGLLLGARQLLSNVLPSGPR